MVFHIKPSQYAYNAIQYSQSRTAGIHTQLFIHNNDYMYNAV